MERSAIRDDGWKNPRIAPLRGFIRATELIRRELDLTMVSCGVRTIAEIDRRVLHEPRT